MKTSISALTAVLVLAGCTSVAAPTNRASSQATPSAVPTPKPMLVMMTESGCGAAPSTIGDVDSGRNSWRLRNQSARLASFQLVQIEEDSFDKLDAHLRGTLEGPEPSPGAGGLPFVVMELIREVVEPGAEGSLADELGPGLFGILCFVLDDQDDIITVYLAGPFTVADGT